MQKLSCYFLAAAFLAAIPTSLADPSPLSPRAALQADYDHIYAAVQRKDLSRAARYFSSDFTGDDGVSIPSDKNPVMNLAALRQVAGDYMQATQGITGYAVIQRLVVSKNQATANVRHHIMLIGTRDPKTGKRFHGIFDAVTQDTWQQGVHGWQMLHGHGLSLQVERHER